MRSIQIINEEFAHQIIESYAPRGRFMIFDNVAPHWIGIDNSSGDCWVEEFVTREDCEAWLNGWDLGWRFASRLPAGILASEPAKILLDSFAESYLDLSDEDKALPFPLFSGVEGLNGFRINWFFDNYRAAFIYDKSLPEHPVFCKEVFTLRECCHSVIKPISPKTYHQTAKSVLAHGVAALKKALAEKSIFSEIPAQAEGYNNLRNLFH